jgi:hypothetical protein
MQIEGIVQAPSVPNRTPEECFPMDLEAPIFSIRTPAKKPPRH